MRGPWRVAAVALLSLSTACGSTVAGAAGSRTALGGALDVPSTPVPQAGSSSSSAALPVTSQAAGNGAGAPSGPGTGTSAPATGPAAGFVAAPGAARRGPLKIGVLYTDNAAANAALGVATSASNSVRSMMDALVLAVNRSGGFAGRQIAVDYVTFDSTSSNYAAQASAACAHFTQDAPVPVVLDLAIGNAFGMASCLAHHGVADFGIGTSDTVSDNAVGLFAAPTSMTSTRRYPAVLDGLHATGYLTSKNKIGILLEGCPELQRAYEQAVLPAISRLGLTRADTEHLDCTTGFSSAGPAASSVQSAVLRFRTAGVDRLLIVSDFEQIILLLIGNDAESQGWRPGYLLSSTAQAEVMRSNIASGQWPQLHGVGWVPGLDIDDPHRPLPTADQRCLDLLKSGGVIVSGWQNTYVATTACADLLFLGNALQGAAGNAQGRALMTAVDGLGAGFVAPSIVGGRTFFGPGRHDGPSAAAPFEYAADCSCLRYSGPPRSVP